MDGVGMVQTLPSGAGEKVVGKKCLPQGFSGKEEEPSIEVARLNEEGSRCSQCRRQRRGMRIRNRRRSSPEISRALRSGRGTTLVISGGSNEIGGRREMPRCGSNATSWGSSSAGRPGEMKARAKR
ncbi:hypothetical protein BHE74_00025698 [Ensete ventricosum]|nr:hypothetical protein BHE74_00025698 [Ensete ventricosum]